MEKQDYVIHTQYDNQWSLHPTRALKINMPPKRKKEGNNTLTYSRKKIGDKSLIG